MVFLGALVFAATYVLVSVRRIDWMPLRRAGVTLLGAAACVLLGVLTPRQAFEAVDLRTLALLLGMMGMGSVLSLDGAFERAEAALATKVGSPVRLLGVVVWGAGLASMVLTNDAVCVLAAPLVVRLVRRHALPPLPFLLALATAANTGSAATLVGNPQNMLCASLGGLDYRRHLLTMLPVSIAGLAVNHAIVKSVFRRELAFASLRGEPPEHAPGGDPRLTVAVIAGTTLLYLSGADLAWSALGGWGVLLLARSRDAAAAVRRIDWSVLLFFAGLFVVVRGFSASGLPSRFFEALPLWHPGASGPFAWARLSGIFLVGSNVVSNVPFILLVKDHMRAVPRPDLAWELLTLASTFAGNLTLLGSVANIIVAESAGSLGGIGFWAYLRVGMPTALATVALGTLWLVWVY